MVCIQETIRIQMMESKDVHGKQLLLGLNLPLQPGIPGSPCTVGFDTSNNLSTWDNCVHFGNHDLDKAMGREPLVIQPIDESELDSDPQPEVTDFEEEYSPQKSSYIEDFEGQTSIEHVGSGQDSNPQPEILDVQQEHSQINSYTRDLKKQGSTESLELLDYSELKLKMIETITVAVKHEDGEKFKDEILEVDIKRENDLYPNIQESDDHGIDRSEKVEYDSENISNEQDTSEADSTGLLVANDDVTKLLRSPVESASEEFGETAERELFTDGRCHNLGETEKNKPTKRNKFCYDCKKQFKTVGDLVAHLSIHHKNENNECKICGFESKNLSGLKVHMQKHFKNEYYPCGFCGMEFRREGHLKRHIRTHELDNYELKTCEICGKKVEARKLKDHTNRHKKESYTCAKCGKEYTTKFSFQNHTCKTYNVKPIICELCGETFFNRTGLKYHMQVHRGADTRSCHICGEGFILPKDLSNHYKTSHPGVKAHQCDICGKEFLKSYALQKHKKIHDPKRPFPCNFCQSRFWKKNIMEVHMKTHTGEI